MILPERQSSEARSIETGSIHDLSEESKLKRKSPSALLATILPLAARAISPFTARKRNKYTATPNAKPQNVMLTCYYYLRNQTDIVHPTLTCLYASNPPNPIHTYNGNPVQNTINHPNRSNQIHESKCTSRPARTPLIIICMMNFSLRLLPFSMKEIT